MASVDNKDIMIRERSEARMLCAELVNIRWKDKSGRGHKTTAILEDISSAGACLQLDSPVPVSTIIFIHHPKGKLQGIVKYCVYRDIGYFVGLQFDPESKWSPKQFQPEHMLDLPRLLARTLKSTARRLRPTVH
ncbi:MAG: PilZ domain-containing protein [Bryobacteraceae bacterium]